MSDSDTPIPVSAQKLVLFCDRHLAALDALRKEVASMRKAAASLVALKTAAAQEAPDDPPR